METIQLNDYNKTKEWLAGHINKVFFPRHPEFNILLELINRHPSKNEWTYQTPTSFRISTSPGNGSLVLHVKFEGMKNYRIVSWVACATGKLTKQQESEGSKLIGAMRYAIRKQISNYRNSHPEQICFLCKTNDRIEVDHYPTHFIQIKDNFIKMKEDRGESTPSDFKWHPKKGNFMFKNGTKSNDYYDKKWKQGWQRYHLQHAEYRYLCSTCNKKTNQVVNNQVVNNVVYLKIPK